MSVWISQLAPNIFWRKHFSCCSWWLQMFCHFRHTTWLHVLWLSYSALASCFFNFIYLFFKILMY
jgi:hypothetical protein